MKEGAKIRFLIVAFPLGLLVIGVLSVFFTQFTNKTSNLDINEAKRLQAASLKRKPVNRADLENFVTVLSNRIGERHIGKSKNLDRAAIWIESSLAGGNIGYQVTRQAYGAGGKEVRNLIAELPGATLRDEIIVVGAHYDSVPNSPGADDDGSGVAALLSLAQAFAGDQQERTIRFVAFVNEEPPFFQTEKMGSRVYTESCRAKGEKIRAMISLKAIGYFSDKEGSQKTPPGVEGDFPSVGNFLAFVGNEESRYFIDSAVNAFQSGSRIPVVAGIFPEKTSATAGVDFGVLLKSNYVGVVVTDTESYRYPDYHKSSDTMDKIDFQKLEDVCRGLKVVIETWANP